MKLLDVNLLLYAVNRDAIHHAAAKDWLERVLSSDEPVAFAWVVVLGFLRISTHARVLPRPLAPEEALDLVDGWLSQPCARTLEPGREHWRILRDLVEETGTAGSLTTDAHLAAIAIEHGAELCSTDADFGRFPRLRWTNPVVRGTRAP